MQLRGSDQRSGISCQYTLNQLRGSAFEVVRMQGIVTP